MSAIGLQCHERLSIPGLLQNTRCVHRYTVYHQIHYFLPPLLLRVSATAHDAAHGAFMTLPPYNRTREGEVRQLDSGPKLCRVGLCVTKCSPEIKHVLYFTLCAERAERSRRKGELCMSNLFVLKCADEATGENILGTLKRLQNQHLITVEDAALVTLKPNGKPKIRQANDLVGAGALGRAFWCMLIGLLFLSPFLGAAMGAGMGALAGRMRNNCTKCLGQQSPHTRNVSPQIMVLARAQAQERNTFGAVEWEGCIYWSCKNRFTGTIPTVWIDIWREGFP